mgnify:CR=1 FL=1
MHPLTFEIKRAHWRATWEAIRLYRMAADVWGEETLLAMTPARFDILQAVWHHAPGPNEGPLGGPRTMPLAELRKMLGLAGATVWKCVQKLAELEAAGYDAAWVGEQRWNGVAILSRIGEPVVTRRRLPGDEDDRQARYIEAAVNGRGVALAKRTLAQADLTSGRLVAPFPDGSEAVGFVYSVVQPRDRPPSPSATSASVMRWRVKPVTCSDCTVPGGGCHSARSCRSRGCPTRRTPPAVPAAAPVRSAAVPAPPGRPCRAGRPPSPCRR